MAKIKNQDIPSRDIIYEYDDPFWFGVAYRQELQEATNTQRAAPEWEIVTKTKRGSRNPQKNAPIGHPSAEQMLWRNLFADMVDGWNRQPYEALTPCQCHGEKLRQTWWQEYQDSGKKCSYFDYFMAECFKYYKFYGVPPPWVFQLEPTPATLSVFCNQEFSVSVTFYGETIVASSIPAILDSIDKTINNVFIGDSGIPVKEQTWKYNYTWSGKSGEYILSFLSSMEHKGCSYISQLYPPDAMTWTHIDDEWVWDCERGATGSCPAGYPLTHSRALQFTNYFDDCDWFRISNPYGGDIVSMDDQYFALKVGACLTPVVWTILRDGWYIVGPINFTNCDGTSFSTWGAQQVALYRGSI